jgi:hypothetical protein
MPTPRKTEERKIFEEFEFILVFVGSEINEGVLLNLFIC